MNILLTGGSSGIGLYFLKNILINFKDCKIFLVSRSNKDYYAKIGISKINLKKIKIINREISKLIGIDAVLDELKNVKIDICINNAGAYFESEFDQNINKSYILNAISPFLISKIILKNNPKAKIINISSFLHKIISKKTLSHFDLKQENLNSHKTYALSKFLMNYLSEILKEQYPLSVILCVNPGIISSEFAMKNVTILRKLISKFRNIIGKNPNKFVMRIINFLKNKIIDFDISANKLLKEKENKFLILEKITSNRSIKDILKNYQIEL